MADMMRVKSFTAGTLFDECAGVAGVYLTAPAAARRRILRKSQRCTAREGEHN
jgi:hypothetical protein